MATDPGTIKRTYPLPAYNYRVRIGETALGFSEVTGLSLQYEPITYKHGLSWKEGAEYMPGMKQPLRITLKRGMVEQKADLLEWIGSVRQNKAEKRDVVIDLCDEAGVPVITWQVRKAIPLKLDAPSLNAASGDVAIESLEIMAGDLLISYHSNP